jgi:hypothetical protein
MGWVFVLKLSVHLSEQSTRGHSFNMMTKSKNIPKGPSKNLPKSLRDKQLDPLYVIFEQHLYNFQDPDVDRKTFVGNVISEYLSHLRKLNISVPKSLEGPIVEELGHQVNTMLVKKIYGCLTIADYQKRVPPAAKKKTRARYSRLAKSG